MIKKHIPNSITLLNLLSGCFSIALMINGHALAAGLCIGLSAFFDLMDGMLARLLKAYSPLGKDLDSLADLVSFGVAPGFMAYFMLSAQVDSLFSQFLVYIPFLMVLASAYRLAKFNNDPEQSTYFKGVPTPANALFWASLSAYWAMSGQLLGGEIIIAMSLLFSYLLLCNFRMFSFKIKDFGLRNNWVIYIFLIHVLALVCVFKFKGIAFAIILYPIFSILHFNLKDRKALKQNN